MYEKMSNEELKNKPVDREIVARVRAMTDDHTLEDFVMENGDEAADMLAIVCFSLERELSSRPKDGWVSVEERLPEFEVVNGEMAGFAPVLFYGPGIGVCAGRYFRKVNPTDIHAPWLTLQGRDLDSHEVTHWMPLPAPPKGEGS